MIAGLSNRKARKARDALWSVAFHVNYLSPQSLPSELEPMPLEPAVETVAGLDDELAAARAYVVARDLLFPPALPDSGPPPEARSLLPMGMSVTPAQFTPRAFIDLDPSIILIWLIANQLALSLATIVALQEKMTGVTGCSFDKVPATIFKGGASKQTQLDSEIIVARRLNELAPLVDPRRWDACSLLFRDTHTVRESGSGYAPFDNGAPIGTDWRGLLYERTEAGPVAAESILDVEFKVVKNGSDVERISVVNELHESITSELTGIEYIGRLRQNSGGLVVRRCDKDPTKSIVRSVKRVNYGRVSRWSAGESFDFGEIANYLAPAMLTLWTNDLQQLIACCDERKHRTGSEEHVWMAPSATSRI